MPIDGLLFTALCRELRQELVNARIQGVHQPSSHELLLHLRQPGRTQKLLISTHPTSSRIHLTEEEPARPSTPLPFALFLRRHLIPGRILDVVQPPFERVARLIVEGQSDEGARVERELIVEATGRYSNLLLVDRSTGLILEAMKRVPESINRYRELLPNRPYTPPPAQEKLDPGEATFEAFDRALRHNPADAPLYRILADRWMGFSPFAGKELLARASLPTDLLRRDLDERALARLWESFQELLRSLAAGEVAPCAVESGGRHTVWLFPILTLSGELRTFPTLSALLDWDYQILASQARREALDSRLRGALKHHLERLERKIAAQAAEVQSGLRAEEFKAKADLLTANLFRLHNLAPGTERITLADFAGGEVEIELDPSLSPAQNAQSYYRKFQRAKKREEKAAAHLEASMAEKEYLESVQTSLSLCERIDELEEVERELLAGGYLKEEKSRPHPQKGGAPPAPMGWRSSDGFAILAGRNNRQNEYLTLRLGKPHDLWLHVKELPGAHVLIRTEGRPVPEQTLSEAAHIAALYSKARDSANVPVDYTECRHVRKPKGSRPGMVIYERQRTVYVTPDPAVIESLKPL